MSTRRLLALVFAIFSTLMLGLAAGAVWMVVSIYQEQLLPWLALPFGILLAWVIRLSVHRPGTVAALLASAATALASIYMNMLLVAVKISAQMGMGLIDTLRSAGVDMLWQLARLGLTHADIGWTLAGAASAALIAFLPARQRQPLPPPR
jgi:hypothetical protein